MKLRKILALALALSMVLLGCAQEAETLTTVPTDPEETVQSLDRGSVTLLFTGGLNNVFARDPAQGQIGYAALGAYRDGLEAEGHQVLLFDGGNSLGDHPDQEAIRDIQEGTGYDLLVPGELELAMGLEDGTYISCTRELEPYVLFEYENAIVGVVGVSTGTDLVGQELWDRVQQSIDGAADAGADYVIVVSNLGTDPASSPNTAVEVIRATTGMAAWLECGSGSVLEGETVTDKDDFEIPVCAVGSGFEYLGQVTLDLNAGTVTVELVRDLEEEKASLKTKADDLLEAIQATAPTEAPQTTEATDPTE